MTTNYKAELVGVLGYPVAENPTCVMQEAAFAALGLQWRYLTIEVEPQALPDAMRGVRAFGMKGINLTIPHKVAVMPLLDEISPDAAMIGAVNTVRRVGNRLVGENTDGKGFLRGLRQGAGIDPAGKRIVVLGAGGAARAITVELALAGAAQLTVVNRRVERGRALVADLVERTGANAHLTAWLGMYPVGPEVDILVNATSIGLFPDVEAMPDVDLKAASPHLLVCDVVPNPPDTRLIQAAHTSGHSTLTGLPMLVYQGAIGFEMWTGHPAPEVVMKSALEKAFGVTPH
jgi:shikimate dehydrogenase